MTIEPRDPGRPRESPGEGLLTFATGLREETAELLNEHSGAFTTLLPSVSALSAQASLD
jgi:hypothetical protein